MTYYIVRFEQFFNGRDITDGLQSIDNRYSDLKRAMEVAVFWESKFPEARIRVQQVNIEDVYDSSQEAK